MVAHIHMPWEAFPGLDDTPGHCEPVGILVYPAPADDLIGLPATLLVLHGTEDELMAIVDAVVGDGWPLIHFFAPQDCQPEHGCLHLAVIHAGHPTDIDLQTAMTRLVGTLATGLPLVERIRPVGT
jgi:hypothetical protein